MDPQSINRPLDAGDQIIRIFLFGGWLGMGI